jgi:5-methylcytosine-specific restriction endonuclease McrA
MPIKPENVHRYPPNWAEIRSEVLIRARGRCENCGVANYALGGRTRDGRWLTAHPLGERLLSLEWPRPGDWAWCSDGTHREELRIVRIVLTIAHLDHTPENCSLENLRAWCQRCHLSYDAQHHAQTAYHSRRAGRALGDLFDAEYMA